MEPLAATAVAHLPQTVAELHRGCIVKGGASGEWEENMGKVNRTGVANKPAKPCPYFSSNILIVALNSGVIIRCK